MRYGSSGRLVARKGELSHYNILRTTSALIADAYELRLIHSTEASSINYGRPISLVWPLREMEHEASAKFLRAKNAQGYNIFFRPADPRFILIDDVCVDAIAAMEYDGIRIAAVIETSPNNFQAWISIDARRQPDQWRVSWETYEVAARTLTQRYNGDLRSAKRKQLGRLAGFRNLKEKHQDTDGGFPWVKVARTPNPLSNHNIREEAEKLTSQRSTLPLHLWACEHDDFDYITDPSSHTYRSSQEYKELFDYATEQLSKKFSLQSTDRSSSDYAIARHLIHFQNMPLPDVYATLLAGSDKAAERGSKYVIQTIRSVVSK
mgnify:FL=1|jgi:hypothetical protein